MSAGPAHAVIPIKRFERGKTRLRERLDDAERARLAREMFERVFDASQRCAHLSGTLVLTDADDIAAYTHAKGGAVLRDPPDYPDGADRLAQLVDAGLAALRERRIEAALVLMADLPDLTPDDLDAMLEALETNQVVLAPDRSGRCTNALALRLEAGRAFRTGFGDPDSLSVHTQRARALGLSVHVCENPRLALDVDVPADLDWPRTART